MHQHLLFLDNLGGGELFVILLFVLIFFGSDRIPGIMKSLGRAMREFNTAMHDVRADIESNIKEPVQSVKRDMQKSIDVTSNEIQKDINNLIEEKKEEKK